jgi:target of rapamycin complex subunit LST8
MPAPAMAAKGASARHDMSVILVTGSYDHEIRFWEAWSGICSRTIARTGESGVSWLHPVKLSDVKLSSS